MDEKIKHRLVGILVILCLVLVIWPLINRDPHDLSLEDFPSPPPLPESRDVQLPSDFFAEKGQSNRLRQSEPELRSHSSAKQKRSGAKSVAPAAEVDPQRKRDTGAVAERPARNKNWRLRVGVFSNTSFITTNLRDSGYQVAVEDWVGSDPSRGPLYAVYIAEKLSQKQAAALKLRIDRRFSVDSAVEEIKR